MERFSQLKPKKQLLGPDVDLIKYCKNITNIPLVAIGGINDKNCQTLIENKIDYLAVISYIWDNEGREVECIEKLSILI